MPSTAAGAGAGCSGPHSRSVAPRSPVIMASTPFAVGSFSRYIVEGRPDIDTPGERRRQLSILGSTKRLSGVLTSGAIAGPPWRRRRHEGQGSREGSVMAAGVSRAGAGRLVGDRAAEVGEDRARRAGPGAMRLLTG